MKKLIFLLLVVACSHREDLTYHQQTLLNQMPLPRRAWIDGCMKESPFHRCLARMWSWPGAHCSAMNQYCKNQGCNKCN